MRRNLALLVVFAAALFIAAPAGATGSNVTVTIRHELRGCHSWAVGTGAYGATHSLKIAKGSSIKFIDNDVMPHQLTQLSGPRVTLLTPKMAKIGAIARVKFSKAGTYVFGTKAGEDYTKGVKTIGEDNVLRLVVTVK